MATDLMLKACDWMLREIGKKDKAVLLRLLDEHSGKMARTMFRYAIECFPKDERQAYLRR
ncbi:MAG: DNA alkylation repair protein [Planctomycetota bacterium]|nr:DNA alkylation repair protein [Planctomycetota bacterium]